MMTGQDDEKNNYPHKGNFTLPHALSGLIKKSVGPSG